MARPGTEVIIGMRRDPTFGPMILFGGGGVYVEALRDVSFRIAPMTDEDARAMLRETVAGRLLMYAPRGQRPGDVDALVALSQRVAARALAVPELAEFEIQVRRHATLVQADDDGGTVTAAQVPIDNRWIDIAGDVEVEVDTDPLEDFIIERDGAHFDRDLDVLQTP